MAPRVRYAPSPTGELHPGTVRTAIFDYLVARRHNGAFVLRIEDTDRSRQTETSLASIYEGLRWLGLNWDEGPDKGGPHAPYVQSERLPMYQEVATRLLTQGDAYRCFCTPERLAQLRRDQEAAHLPTRYDRRCAVIPPEEAERRAQSEPFTIRMRIPEGSTEAPDLLRGTLHYENSSQDDQVLVKSDGYPTYHLAATVDDHLMEITHVIRGEEWLGSFPKHLILYRMLGWEPPLFAHVPLVLGPDRAKLSKRHGSRPLLEYRADGYLPGAMVNFLAFLGWSPGTGQEFFTLDELGRAFELERVQVSPAVFDIAKLDSVNGQHIRALPPEEFVERLRPFVPELPEQLLVAGAPLVQERIQRLTDAAPLLRFLVERPSDYPPELVPKKADRDSATAALQQARTLFAQRDVGPELEAPLRALADDLDWKAGDLFMTLRVAITGSTKTPPLLESCRILGREECLTRIDAALEFLRTGR